LFDKIYRTETKIIKGAAVPQHYYIHTDGTKTPVCRLCRMEIPPSTNTAEMFCPACYERVNHEWKKTFKTGIKKN
jgi:predicted RNA-binding Zn-ribbon protein involved in translation (DUF1610 family)